MPVRFGVDRVVRDPSLLGRADRVGLVTNEAARLAEHPDMPSRVALMEAGIPLVRLFSPEHGLTATGADGAPVQDGVDARTGLPIVSLYGERFAPPDDTLADLDLVLFDIPDVGARFYTYAWTLSHVLESCARTGTPLLVLDRPNPLGGRLDLAEGPMLDEATCASFIGRWSIPIRHSLTLGELATLWSSTRVPGANVRVITCQGWRRDEPWPSFGLPWIPTSLAMPSFESALLYPGTCLFEATNLSVGRGSQTPFRCVAAPWLDAEAVVATAGVVADVGVTLRAGRCTPQLGPHRGSTCNAVDLSVENPMRVRPVVAGLALLAAVLHRHRDHFAWVRYPTAANPSGDGHLARLCGQEWVAARLDAMPRPDLAELQRWTAVPEWGDVVRDALLY